MSSKPRTMDISDAAAWLIMPPRSITYHSYQKWVTGTAYSQGDIVRGKDGGDTENELYMALAAGTSAGTAGPVNLNGEALDDTGGVLWLYVPQLPRAGGEVTNDSTKVIFVGLDHEVAAGKGNRINAAGGSYSIPKENLQEPVYAIGDTGAGSGLTLSIQER